MAARTAITDEDILFLAEETKTDEQFVREAIDEARG